jgi:hypothetical protein
VNPTARTLEEFATCGGVSAIFSAGSTGAGHHWQLFGQDGSQLARTARVHNGGKIAQLWWKAVTLTGMDANNDIHVELIGADGSALARASASYMKETVTLSDPTGRHLGHTKRDKKVVTVYGADDVALAEFTCEGDDPWPVRRPSGEDIGEVLAGEPGPSLSAPLWQWALDTQWALNTTAYRQAMHLGLRRVNRYSFTPTRPVVPMLALLPLLCGLSY